MNGHFNRIAVVVRALLSGGVLLLESWARVGFAVIGISFCVDDPSSRLEYLRWSVVDRDLPQFAS